MTGLEVQEIESGLWRWTAPHPEWDPDPTATTGWVEQVGSVYCELPGALLLVDPVVPADAEATRPASGARSTATSSGCGRPVYVVVTVHWHRRGADAMVARYGAHDGVVPDGARAMPSATRSERPPMPCPISARSCVGDVVIGGDAIEGERAEGVRVCPPGWYGSTAAERAWYGGAGLPSALRRLAQEPAERIYDARLAAPERRLRGAARAGRERSGRRAA